MPQEVQDALDKGMGDDFIAPEATIKPLLDAIVEYIPHPVGNKAEPLQMLISSLEYDT